MKFQTFYTEQLAKGKTLQDIAKKHGVELSELEKELEKGAKVEMEHTDSHEQAKKVAMDHLFENPKYYTKLAKVGL